MNVQVINKSKHPLPAYATVASAGMDLRANLNEPIVLKPLQRCLVPTGLFMALPVGINSLPISKRRTLLLLRFKLVAMLSRRPGTSVVCMYAVSSPKTTLNCASSRRPTN